MSQSSRPRADSSLLTLAACLAVLFLLSALLGVWAAYDRGSAWQAFGLLAGGLAGAAAVAWAGRRWGEPALAGMSLAAALLAGAVGAYFLLSNTWADDPGKLGLIQQIGLAVQALRPAVALPEDINANVAANALIITLFLGLGGLLWAVRRRRWASLTLAGLAWLTGLAALILSQSRGAWLSAAVGVAAIGYLLLRRRLAGQRGPRVALDLLALCVVLTPVVLFVTAVRTPEIARWLGTASMGTSAVGRATLWRDGLDLAADYPFTGSGLRSTMMVYSTYGLLLHVGFIHHMHNLLLQITVEQGLAGMLAFVGLLAAATVNLLAATRPRRPNWRFGLAAGGALAAQVAHGVFDAGVYASLAAPLFFLSIGFALALEPRRGRAEGGSQKSEGRGRRTEVRSQRAEDGGRRTEVRSQRAEDGGQRAEVRSQRAEDGGQRAEVRSQRAEDGGRRTEVRSQGAEDGGGKVERGARERGGGLRNWPLVGAGLAVVALAVVVFTPGGNAALLANLGAVAQTRAELAEYAWPRWPIQDELRRSPAIDLGPAIARYQDALARNPGNAVANRRLGQIELARGDYAAARAHLEAAYAVAPQRRATRQLLGELYTVEGETARGAELLATVDTDLGQLDLRTFWYEHIGEMEKAARLKQLAGP